jgi:hypothetical protein
MKAGEIILIGGAVGLGILVIVKARQAQSSAVVPPAGAPPIVNAQFDMSGLGAAGPLAPILAPLQPAVKGTIDTVNKKIGGANPYAGLTKNSDGTYTDGMGCKLTFKPDGTYNRVCPQKSAAGYVATGVRKIISIF